MSHVFISYVHDDEMEVQRLFDYLKEQGITVWLDRNDIMPGTRWQQAIRTAIREGAFFIACFSKKYNQRADTYMNKELTLAIDRLQEISTTRAWFIPLKLNECEVPDRDIGGGDSLRDLQYIELYKDWNAGTMRVVKVIQSFTITTNEVEDRDGNRNVTVIEVDGRLIGDASLEFRRQINGIISSIQEEGKPVWLILDLSKVVMIDSQGLGYLVAAFTYVKRTVEQSSTGNLVLAAPPERLQNLIAAAKLARVFDIYETVEEARLSFPTLTIATKEVEDTDGNRNVTVIEVDGRLIGYASLEFRSQMIGIISSIQEEGKPVWLILDLSKVVMIDPSGLGMLVSILSTLEGTIVQSKMGHLVLAALPNAFRELIKDTRLTPAFDIYRTVEEARLSFPPPSE